MVLAISVAACGTQSAGTDTLESSANNTVTDGSADIATEGPADIAADGSADIVTEGPADIATEGSADIVSDGSSANVTEDTSAIVPEESLGSVTIDIEGRYLRAEEAEFIVSELHGPFIITWSGISDTFDGFAGYDNGDLFSVHISLIGETWPGQATIYEAKFLEDGTLDDIDPEVIIRLEENGYTVKK